jgi:hypothetical protein
MGIPRLDDFPLTRVVLSAAELSPQASTFTEHGLPAAPLTFLFRRIWSESKILNRPFPRTALGVWRICWISATAALSGNDDHELISCSIYMADDM